MTPTLPKMLRLLSLMLVLLLALAACGGDGGDAADDDGGTDAGDDDAGDDDAGDDDGGGDGSLSGDLLWYTSIPTVASAAVMEQFSAMHPDLNGEVLRLPTFELWERFQSEYVAGRNLADVIGVADWGVMEEAKDAGYIAEGLPDSVQEAVDGGHLAEAYVDPEGYWFSLRLTTIAFVYNTYNIPEEQGQITSWLDLCDDYWGSEVRLGTGDPREAAGIYEAFWQFEQEGFGEELFTCISEHDPTIYALGGQQLNALTSGEIDAGIIVDYNPYGMIDAGVPLQVVYPEEGVGGSPDYNAMVADAPNPEAAAAFVDWLGSAEGNEAVASALNTYVVRTDVPAYPTDIRPPLADVKVLSGDPEAAVNDYEAFNDRWDGYIGR